MGVVVFVSKKIVVNNNFCEMDIHGSEKRLIEMLRSMERGEIESIKIQNGIPVFYRIALSGEMFLE
jgi:bisphosphoglycerate-dependent phosphoglycerate mutase